jgi:hypothetical protein
MDHPFAPGGPTYLVTNVAVQILPGAGQSFKVVNLAAALQYLAWGLTNAVTVTAPIAGTPQPNTIGIPSAGAGLGADRIITIPTQGLWFIASSATGFLVTQGDGT